MVSNICGKLGIERIIYKTFPHAPSPWLLTTSLITCQEKMIITIINIMIINIIIIILLNGIQKTKFIPGQQEPFTKICTKT